MAPAPLIDAVVQDPGQATAKQHAYQVVELRQAERVGGVKNLAERRQLQRLGDQRACSPSDIVSRQREVDEHVGEHLGEIAGLSMERIVVEQDHRYAGGLKRPEQIGEQ